MKHYTSKTRQYKVLKRVYDALNESANKLFEENEYLKIRIYFFEQNYVLAKQIDDDHENALHEFIRNSIKRSKLASMIYGVSRNKGEDIAYSQFSYCEKPKQSACINKTPSDLYSTFVKGSSEDLNRSDVEQNSELEVSESEVLITSEPKISEPKIQVILESKSPVVKTLKKSNPKTQKSKSLKHSEASPSGPKNLIYSRSWTKNKPRARTSSSKGYVNSKASEKLE
jgi:hypothetical protein